MYIFGVLIRYSTRRFLRLLGMKHLKVTLRTYAKVILAEMRIFRILCIEIDTHVKILKCSLKDTVQVYLEHTYSWRMHCFIIGKRYPFFICMEIGQGSSSESKRSLDHVLLNFICITGIGKR